MTEPRRPARRAPRPCICTACWRIGRRSRREAWVAPLLDWEERATRPPQPGASAADRPYRPLQAVL